MDQHIGNGNPPNTEPELSEQDIKKLTTAEDLVGADASEVANKNKQLFARLQKEKEARIKAEESATKAVAESKKAYEALAAVSKPDSSPQAPVDDLPIREVLKLRSDGYSEKEILELVDEAKGLGVPVSKILSNDIFKQGLEVKRSKQNSEANTPPSSFSTIVSPTGKKWEDRNLSDDERRNMFQNMMGEAGRRRTSNE